MKLPNFLEMRIRGRRIARSLADSLDKNFQFDKKPLGPTGFRLDGGKWTILSTKCDTKCLGFLRLFDSCVLHYEGVEEFLPLLSRIRLRNAARVYLQRNSEHDL